MLEQPLSLAGVAGGSCGCEPPTPRNLAPPEQIQMFGRLNRTAPFVYFPTPAFLMQLKPNMRNTCTKQLPLLGLDTKTRGIWSCLVAMHNSNPRSE